MLRDDVSMYEHGERMLNILLKFHGQLQHVGS